MAEADLYRGVQLGGLDASALERLLERHDGSGVARKLLAGLNGAAKESLTDFLTAVYSAGVKSGVDNALEADPAKTEAAAPVEETPAPASGRVRSPIQAVIERFRSNQVRLPSLPDTSLRINQLLEQPEFDFNEVVKVIRCDPAMTSKVMHLAASPVYAVGGRAPRTLNDAVMRIGSKELTAFLLAACNRRLFAFQGSAEALAALWAHSLMSGLLAEQLARHVESLHPPSSFLHGLFHDLGRALLMQIFDEVQAEGAQAFSPKEIEDTIEALHGQFGATLVQRWGFDADFAEVAEHHHNYEAAAEDDRPATALVTLAEHLALEAGHGAEKVAFDGAPEAHPAALFLELDAVTIAGAVQGATQAFEAMSAVV